MAYRYFHSWFHCVDALVIIAGLVIDVLLHGPLEEAASLIVILRLWRIFKIVEELSAGAQEEMDDLEEKIRRLEGENGRLNQEIVQERRRLEGENGKLRNQMGQLRMRVHDREDDNKGERCNTPPTPD
jgi:DNA repair exonuclease SbcCD ATPase subunit